MLGLGNLLTKSGVIKKFPNDFSFNFDGSNDYLDCGNSTGIQFSGSFSVSFWFNTTDATATNEIFVSKANDGDNDGWLIRLNSSRKLEFEIYRGGSILITDSGSASNDGNWHHVVAVHESGVGNKLYKNGSLVASNSTGTDLTEHVPNLHIGNQDYSTPRAIKSLIDEVAIWDTALSASDVAKIASKPVDFSKASKYATDRTGNLKLWLRCGDKAEPESNTAIARQDFYTDFDGTDDFVSVADNDDLSFGDGSSDSPFSISAWINPVDATNFTIVSKGVFNTDAEYIFQLDGDDKLFFSLYDESVNNTFEGAYFNTALTSLQDSWFHVCATYNGVGGTSANAGVKLYIDGVEKSTTLIGGGTYVAMENLGGELEIGRISSTYANGKISNLALYKTQLDAQTISQFAKSRFTPMRDNRFSVVDFDGANDYIDTGTGLGTSLGDSYTGDLSFSIWANLTDVSAINDALVHIGDFSNNHGVITIVSLSNNIIFRLNGTTWSVTETLTSGWHHIMAVWDSSDYTKTKLYVDGVTTHADNSSSFPSSLNFDGMKTIIGAFYSSSFTYDGSISSVSIYNTAKLAEEVYAIYQQGITYDESSLSGLVAYYRMGDDTSKAYPTIADSSSNSNDGTITNGASDDIVQQMVAGYDMGAFESSSEELGGEIVNDSSFDTALANGATNANFKLSGVGEITGGAWSFTSGGGVGRLTVMQDASTQYTFVSGRLYKLQLTIVSSGNALLNLDFVNSSFVNYANGTHTLYAVGDGSVFQIQASGSGNSFTLTDISFKEVLQSDLSDTHPAIIDVNEPVLGVETLTHDFSNGTGVTVPSSLSSLTTFNGEMVVNGGSVSSDFYVIADNVTWDTSKLYKIVVVCSAYTSGSLTHAGGSATFGINFGISSSIGGVGTFTNYAVPNQDGLIMLRSQSFIGTLSSISIKEVKGNFGTMTNQDSADLVYSSVLPDQSFLTGANSSYGFGSFDGTNDVVTANAVNTDYKSVSFWMKPTTTFTTASSGKQIMFFGSWDFGSITLGTATGSLTNELITMVDNQGSGTVFTGWIPTGGETIPNDSWTHIAFVWDGSKYVIYYNGQPQTVTTSGTGHVGLHTNRNIKIGTGNTGDIPFDGDMTGVAFWNKSLTDAQILSIYNNGRHSNLYTDFSDNLITYLAFGNLDATSGFEDTSSTIYDRSGNSNHGTVSGTTLQSPPNAEPEGYAKGDINRSTTTP